MRNLYAALFLVPTSMLASHAASAAPQVAVAQAPVVSTAVVASQPALPAGVHLRSDGRYTKDNCDHSQKHYCLSKRLLPRGWTPDQPIPAKKRIEKKGGGSLLPEGMSPTDIINAYKIPSNAAANGKIVAILDSPDSNALSDLTEYRAVYGLPTLPRCSGLPTGTSPCFAQVSESGGTSTGQDAGEDSDGETSLDMDMISAACPDCSILLVEISNLTDNDFIKGAKTAAALGAVATSISIGGPEGAGPNDQGGQDPKGYTTPGHLVLAATGDFGYNLINEDNAGSPGYPASAPDILAVGGTTLFRSGSSYEEAVWNDGTFASNQNGQDVTTSGCSTEFAAPSWQLASLTGTGCANRATADVSAASAFYDNGQLVDIAEYQQGWSSAEGTSAASPMIAGILTRLGLAEIISNNLAWPYQNPTGWNDLGSSAYPVDSSGSDTDSNDPSSCGKLCTTGDGWDGPSGLGTPNGTSLAALAGLPQPPPEVDAGVDTGSPGSGTGTGSTGETSTGGSGSGTTVATAAPGSLGSGCLIGTDCNSGTCGEPAAGEPAVCTQACTGTGAASTCLLGFACTGGYCFAESVTSASSGDGGTSTGLQDTSSPSSSGGCAVSSSSDDSAGWAAFGWVGLGLAAVAKRRKNRVA